MKKRKEFIPLKHPVCSDAVDEMEGKSVFSRVWERGVGHIFGLVWF